MSEHRKCPQCGRQFEEDFEFCPFDATALGRKCPACGKVWNTSFQFCPLDSTPLGGETAPSPSPPPPPAQPPPPPTQSVPRPPVSATPAGFTFEEAAKWDWRSLLLRPVVVIFALGTLAVGAAVFYLTEATGGSELPPAQITYALLQNEGRSKGVPVAIKINQVVICAVDDPMESGGAARAQQVVKAFEQAIAKAKGSTGVRFAVENVGGRPAILEVSDAGPDKTTLATVTDGDVALAGETDATRVAARWAERLTDAVKVYVFGEPPTFSVGTEFGNAFAAMFKAAAGPRGRITKKTLDRAFQQLTPAQRKALETPPLAPQKS